MLQKTFSISRKLVFFVILVSMIAIFTTAFLSFNSAERILKENTQDLLIGEAALRGESIVNLFETRINDVGILAENSKLNDLLRKTNPSQIDESSFEQKRNEFLKIIDNYQNTVGYSIDLEDIKIIDNNGVIVFSLVEIKPNDVMKYSHIVTQNITEATADLELQENMTRKLVVIHPIWYETSEEIGENLFGILVAKMRTADIDKILLNRSGLGKTGEVYLVNEEQVLMSESRFLEDAAFDQIVDTVPVIKCFEEKQNVSGVTYEDYRGVQIFGASYCAQDLGFVLISEIDVSETFEPVNTLQKEILFAGILVTSGIGILAFVLGNFISGPLVKLTSAVNEVANGNFGVRTNIRTKDEIGVLSSAFDSMAKRMQEAMISIKQRDDVIKQQENELLKFSDFDHNYCVGFVDIVNSTKTTSTLSDSETDKFYGIFLNSIASVIANFEGLIVKNVGDALLFYFPRTQSTEDLLPFKNVLECCIAMIDAHDKINQSMRKEKLPSLDYRISIAYGSVRIAKVFTSSVEDIFGSTVNKCAKINRLAKPNGIVIGNNLYQIVKSLDKRYVFEKIESEQMMEKYGYDTVYSITKKI